MILDYKEMEQKINDTIAEKNQELKTLYQTLDEANKYGFVTTFTANTEEETIKSAINYGRKIGEIQGEIDQLNNFLNFLYNQEFNKEE